MMHGSANRVACLRCTEAPAVVPAGPSADFHLSSGLSWICTLPCPQPSSCSCSCQRHTSKHPLPTGIPGGDSTHLQRLSKLGNGILLQAGLLTPQFCKAPRQLHLCGPSPGDCACIPCQGLPVPHTLMPSAPILLWHNQQQVRATRYYRQAQRETAASESSLLFSWLESLALLCINWEAVACRAVSWHAQHESQCAGQVSRQHEFLLAKMTAPAG